MNYYSQDHKFYSLIPKHQCPDDKNAYES